MEVSKTVKLKSEFRIDTHRNFEYILTLTLQPLKIDSSSNRPTNQKPGISSLKTMSQMKQQTSVHSQVRPAVRKDKYWMCRKMLVEAGDKLYHASIFEKFQLVLPEGLAFRLVPTL
jgi:hypothetical protein